MYQDQCLSHKENVRRERMMPLRLAMLARRTFFLSITAGTAVLSTPSVYADEISNEKTILLPKLTVEESHNENPIYSGTDGQILETNKAGFLGNKDLLDTPFSAVSYTDKFIEDQQATDVTDIISATDASVHSSHTSGESRESYSIRGFSSSSNDVTVNGLAGMAPYFRSSTEMYERAEVLKGPSAMLNGMAVEGSLGGSINLVTKRAGDEPLTRLTTKYLSDSQLGGHIDVSRRYGEKKQVGIRINGAYLDGKTTVKTQKKESELGAIALDWRSDRARIFADFYHTNEQVDAPIRGTTVATGIAIPRPPSADTALNPTWANYQSETEGAMAHGEFDINDKLTAYASFGVTKWDYKGLSADSVEISNSAGDMKTTLGTTDDGNQRESLVVGLNGHFNTGKVGHQIATNVTRFTEDQSLIGKRFSGDYHTNIYNPDWGSKPDYDTNGPSVLLDSTTKTTLSSFGLADTLSFADDKFQLTLGARYQQVKTAETGYMARGPRSLPINDKYNESAITPSAAFMLKLTDNLSAYANYIEGLNKGATAPTTADNAGEMFSPYKTKQKEIGLKIDRGEFTHTISLYEIARPNSHTDTETNLFGYYGEQRNRGIEWGFFGTPVEDVRLMGGLTYINAEITSTADGVNEGNQAAGTPDWEAKLGVEWDTPQINNLTVIANVNAVSEQYLNNDNLQSLPSYTLYGLGARYTTSINAMPLIIRANIDNLTDKLAWTTASYSDLALIKGRSLTLSAALEF